MVSSAAKRHRQPASHCSRSCAFVTVRDRSYLYYVLFLLVFMFFWAAYFGFVQELYWPAGLHTHPALLFYLIAERHLISGLTGGSLKE